MPEEKWVPRDELPNGILAEGWEALPDGTKYTWTVPGNQAKQKAAMEDRELWDMLIQEKIVEAKALAKQQASAARVEENMLRLTKLEDAFSHFDADGSGALDNEEVMKILMRVGPEDTNPNAMTEDDAKEFINLFDQDGSGKMEIKEFIEAMKAIAGLEGLDVKEDTEVVADILVEGGMSTELEVRACARTHVACGPFLAIAHSNKPAPPRCTIANTCCAVVLCRRVACAHSTTT
jgi:hypothetical protein